MRAVGNGLSKCQNCCWKQRRWRLSPGGKKKSHYRKEDQPGSGYKGLEPREATAAGGSLSPAEAWEDETLPYSSLLLAKPLSKPLAVKGPCQSTCWVSTRKIHKKGKMGPRWVQIVGCSVLIPLSVNWWCFVLQEEPWALHLSIAHHTQQTWRQRVCQSTHLGGSD